MITKLILAYLAMNTVDTSNADEFKCKKFADGSVYPSSTIESTNHKLQYTKALSK